MAGNSIQDHYAAGDDTGCHGQPHSGGGPRSLRQRCCHHAGDAGPTRSFQRAWGGGDAGISRAPGPAGGRVLLDIGSGIGGPARWIATRYGCTVTGVDVTAAFCEAARALNAACGVTDRVRIVDGTALALPFPAASFDRAYSHGVLEHCRQGRGLSGGVARAATGRPAGAGPAACWTERSAGLSGVLGVRPGAEFSRDADTHRDLTAAGFAVASLRDTTQEEFAAQTALGRTIEVEGRRPRHAGVDR